MTTTFKFISAFYCLATLLSVTGCQKHDADSSISKEKIAGTYKTTALLFKSTSGVQIDLFATLDDCQKQSRQVLNSDQTFQLIDECTPPDNHNGSWQLISSSQIVIDGISADILSFDGSKLSLQFDQDLNGVQGKTQETLTKQ